MIEIFAETYGDFWECLAKYNRSEGGGGVLPMFRLAL